MITRGYGIAAGTGAGTILVVTSIDADLDDGIAVELVDDSITAAVESMEPVAFDDGLDAEVEDDGISEEICE